MTRNKYNYAFPIIHFRKTSFSFNFCEVCMAAWEKLKELTSQKICHMFSLTSGLSQLMESKIRWPASEREFGEDKIEETLKRNRVTWKPINIKGKRRFLYTSDRNARNEICQELRMNSDILRFSGNMDAVENFKSCFSYETGLPLIICKCKRRVWKKWFLGAHSERGQSQKLGSSLSEIPHLRHLRLDNPYWYRLANWRDI